ncbi:MAG TPA: sigma 54-interacting transcriptional regulator, partial [Isosphaeraceae bacterium]
EQAFERVGGNETVRTDVRLIAATHRDLEAWSAQGKYRPDLYYRLGVFTVHLPPLRERGDDLPMLVQHYVLRFGRELGREAREVSPEAIERLRAYPWPGNVRELQSVLKQALLKSTGPVLVSAFLPDLVPRKADDPATTGGSRLEALIEQRLRNGGRDLYEEARRELDRFLLPLVLRSTGGNQFQAARTLGIARRTLRLRLRELGLSVTKSIQRDEDNALAPE